MIARETLSAVGEACRREGRLLALPADRELVFVGDTHGDREATEIVLSRFLSPTRAIVFLGDYVDRGVDSEGNLRALLEAKLRFPDQVVLLMGNHEGYCVTPFTTADFWEGLSAAERSAVAAVLLHLPLAAFSPRGLVALHGALPDLPGLEAIRTVLLGSEEWRAMTWGDYVDLPTARPAALHSSRPTFGRAVFEARAARLGVRVLVRSHQPSAPTYLFDGRCLTLFTSSAYGRGERRVAVLSPGGEISSAEAFDLVAI